MRLTDSPVVNVPVVGGKVDEPVVVAKLLLGHGGQVLVGKRAKQQAILEHAPLA